MLGIPWLFARGRRYSELSTAIDEHLREKIEDLIEGGMPPEEARRAALRSFGNRTLLEQRGREVWQWARLENLWADTRFSLRQLVKAPAFTTTAVLTLALGIGANTGIFTLLHALLLRSLPVPQPRQMVRIALDVNSPFGAAADMPLNLLLLQSINRHAKSLAGVFGWSSYDFVLKEDNGLHVFPGALVSGNAFDVLWIAPAAGRLLTPADDRNGGGPDGWAAVISYRFWQQHFHGDRSIIGTHIQLTGHSVTIVGVAPQGFEGVFVATHPDFYLPLEYEPVMRGAGSVLHTPGNLWLTTWARLRPDVTFDAASAELRLLFKVAAAETLPPAVLNTPVVKRSTFALRLGAKGWSSLQPQYTRPLLLLQVLVGVVLLVCCINLAGLCLARASTREAEFAIRRALGAPRGRLMRQPFLESLILALGGGVLAVGFAWAIDRYLLQFLGDRQAAHALSVRPEPATLLATGACAILCAILFGTAPAWFAAHVSSGPALHRHEQSVKKARAGLPRLLFVPVQVALTVALVVVAAMLGASVMHLETAHLGFETRDVIFVPADFERLPQKGAALVDLYRRMLSSLQQAPGVESASVAEDMPLSGVWQTGFFGESAAGASDASTTTHHLWTNDVGSGYFQALGTHLLAGRFFTDHEDHAGACILNRSAAASIFGRRSPLGLTAWQSIHSMNSGQTAAHPCRVVGVVEDAKYGSLREPAPPTVYLPFGPDTERLASMYFVIHARTAALARGAYQEVLREFAPDTPENEPVTFAVQLQDSIGSERLLSVLAGFFAALAVLLSSIGVYGLLSAYVNCRTTEIGVRMALGAKRSHILGLVLRNTAVLFGVGAAAGGVLAWFAARAIRAFLFEVSPGNPTIFAAAVLLMAFAGLVASLLPARRAVFIEPIVALRNE